MIRPILIISLLLLGMLACSTDSSSDSDRLVEETPVKTGGRNADIIRNPVGADENVDTVNVAKMVFGETSYNFGKIKEGEVINHTYTFTNTGNAPLLISHAKSTCGCTVPDWPKDPIEPGAGGEIKVKFDSKGKKNFQDKPITIISNTYPSKTVIHLRGHVTPSEEN